MAGLIVNGCRYDVMTWISTVTRSRVTTLIVRVPTLVLTMMIAMMIYPLLVCLPVATVINKFVVILVIIRIVIEFLQVLLQVLVRVYLSPPFLVARLRRAVVMVCRAGRVT